MLVLVRVYILIERASAQTSYECVYVLLTVHPDTMSSLFFRFYEICAQIIYFNTFTTLLYRMGRGIAVLFRDRGTGRW